MNYEILMHIPGRLRIKINNLYRNKKLAEKFDSISNSMIVLQPNIYTSNMLVFYDSEKTSFHNILNYIKSIVDSNIESQCINPNIEECERINSNNGRHIVKASDSIRKNNIYGLIKKYAVKIAKMKFVKKILVVLGFLSLLRYDFNLAVLIIAIYYLNKLVRLLLNAWFMNQIKQFTGHELSKNFINSMSTDENTENASISSTIRKIEIFSILTGLLLYSLGGNPNVLFSAIVLSQMNLMPLINNLNYISSYFNGLKNNILLINKEKVQNLETIDSLIIIVDKKRKCINETIIEDLRGRGILDIRIISDCEQNYLNQLGSDLGVNVIYCRTVEKGLMNELTRLKKQNKKIVMASFTNNLHIPKNISDDIDLSILICEIECKNKNFDIKITDNNNLLGDTIDYTKYIREKNIQNQLLIFWIYVYCNILIFSKNIAPLYIWLIASLNKVIVYFNSLKPLKYNFNLNYGVCK
ncbi:MAG: hypothetical protein SA378_03325 [Sedimentibacter sp.]|uniref:hypothetical protein n=1 Tax=Sedimentibacter sp. TaxID=1960295 RepID=UPI002981D985|nr:hypothetical protein [Sedimentibacter sp.]MDW5299157.1 hypothetical protein [Sedimentibacter sp.]